MSSRRPTNRARLPETRAMTRTSSQGRSDGLATAGAILIVFITLIALMALGI